MASQSRPTLQKRLSSFKNSEMPTVKKAPNAPAPRTPARPGPGKSSTTTAKSQASKKPTYSKEAEEKFHDILEGKFHELPPIPRSTVRIFLSSTFSDMRAERNALARFAYPKLRDFCQELDLTFQVVDLRWGVTSEATNNHLTTKICLLELENCKKVSLGPYCIALLGDRYGSRPLPHTIPLDEFQILKQEVTDLALNTDGVIDTWYQRDENFTPAVYVLQPVNSLLPHFLDNDPSHQAQKQADVSKWYDISQKLATALYSAAISACGKGKLTEERKGFYTMSVTEHEVRVGILACESPDRHSLAFFRNMTGLTPEVYTDSMATRYKDTIEVNGEILTDKEIEASRASLRSDVLTCLPEGNSKQYTVTWQAGGVDPSKSAEHEKYLKEFCDDFVNKVIKLIQADQVAKESLIRRRNYASMYGEVLHHAHFCETKCRSFCGQQDTLDKIKAYILDPNNRKPLVLYAKSGAGKTSVMAMAMSQLRSWISEDQVGIIRFLGTSLYSTDLYCVLRGVCAQLADNAGVIMEPQGYKTMKGLLKYVPRFFRNMSNSLKQPVTIFLDSLDQLESSYDAYSCSWLPINLPSNFKLILSTLPKEHKILDNLRKVIGDERNFVKVPLLPESTGQEIVDKYLTLKERKVTEEQMKFVLQTFQKSAQPLYLKLLMDEAMNWSSQLGVSSLSLPGSVREAITQLFMQLEGKFGNELVRSALGLLTAGLSGLSEIELEDAISCIDSAMVEVYKYHDPPVPGIVRVPPVLWARLRYDIHDYLVERQSQGQITLFWYHRQFLEVARERYTQGDQGENLHKVLFEYFAAEDGVKRDITLTQRRNLHVPEADRNTTPQLMTASNSRKLECLTYHLMRSLSKQDLEFAKQVTYCNLMFIRCKVAADGVDSLIAEMEEFLRVQPDTEVQQVLQFIKLCKNSLRDPSVCAFNVLAYIKSSPDQKSLASLKDNARSYLQSQRKNLLLPSLACLTPRHGEPDKVLDGLSSVLYRNEDVMVLTNGLSEELDVSEAEENEMMVARLDMSTGDVIKYMSEGLVSPPILTSPDKELLYLSLTDSTLVRHLTNGEQKCTSLTDIIGKSELQHMRLTKSYCQLAQSSDSKLLALSIEDRVFLLSWPDLKLASNFSVETQSCITNLHCVGGQSPSIVASGTYANDKDVSQQGMVSVWCGGQKAALDTTHTKFKVESGASAVTAGQDFHICYGQVETGKSVIEVRRIRPTEKFQEITVAHGICAMNLSPTDPEGWFLLGGSTLQLLNAESREFTKTLAHSGTISAWDVAWDTEHLVIVGDDNSINMYDTNDLSLLQSRRVGGPSISSVAVTRDQIVLVNTEEKLKIWNRKEFFSSDATLSDPSHDKGDQPELLENQHDIRCLALSLDSQELITLGTYKVCKRWSLSSQKLVGQFNTDIVATEMHVIPEGKLLALDSVSGQVRVYDISSGQIYCDSLPANIGCLTLMAKKTKALLVAMETKPVVYIYDIKSNSSSKLFTVNLNFKFEREKCQVILTPSERYAVLRVKVTQKEYNAIAAMWRKGQNLPKQAHPYRFVAVDLSKKSGAPLYAFHRLSKVPHLGVAMSPYMGNSIMLSSRRWVMFWDIPTGSCDQTMCKVNRKTKMYRPDWLGRGCVGANEVMVMSHDHKHVAVGSEDGYLMVYGAENGIPVGMKAPTTKHSSPVNQASFSGGHQLLASSCTSGSLKLWDVRSATCLFSVSVGTELRQMAFTLAGDKLVALTQAEKSRVLLFDAQEVREN